MSQLPTGIGLYVRRLGNNRHGTPKQLAKRFADHGLSWVAIEAVWHAKQSTIVNSKATIRRYSEAFATQEIKPWLWCYPWHDRIDLLLSDMHRLSAPPIVGWLLDPEVGMKGKPDACDRLVDGTLQWQAQRNASAGWTSYGLIRGHMRGRNALNVESFDCLDFGSPQLYTLDNAIRTGLDQWSALHQTIVPSFGLYRWQRIDGKRKARPKSAEQLRRHLGEFVSAPQLIDALIGWELAFMRPPLWRELATWSDWIARGACALPRP